MKLISFNSILIQILTFLLFIAGCERYESDYRDKYIGTYSCIQTYDYPTNPGDGSIVWKTDTAAFNTSIFIEKHGDSSISVSFDSNNGSFVATSTDKGMFVCLFECQGPYNYAKFPRNDSISVYQKWGVTTSFMYYGTK